MFRAVASTALLAAVLPLFPAEKPRLPEAYSHWLNQEVVYLITDEEKKAFLKLDTNEARDRFIEEFWAARNPVRGARENSYKDEILRRIEYANSHFGRQSNTPGWMTDMGRTYIELGKPESVARFTGQGQIYPIELWFYSNEKNPSLPPFFYVLFFMPGDIGEYRYYRPGMDGPMKLVRGSNFRGNADVYRALSPLGGDLARAAFSLIPSDPVDTTDFQPNMSGDMLVSKLQNLNNDSFYVRQIREARAVHAKVNSYFLVPEDQPLEITAFPWTDSAGGRWLDYGVLIDREVLGTPQAATGQLQVSLGYRLLNAANELIVEDRQDAKYAAYENGKFEPFQIASRLPMATGRYRLEVEVTNRGAGKTWRGAQTISLDEPAEASVSGPVLAASVERVARPDAASAFQYFGIQFRPSLARTFDQRDPLRVLYEISVKNPRDLEAEYLLAHAQNREMRRSVTDPIAASEFRGGRLLKSKTLPLTGLEAGDYRLIVSLRPSGSREVLASLNVPLKVGEAEHAPRVLFAPNNRSLLAPGVAPYIRGLEAIAQKNDAAAEAYLREAIDQNPRNGFAGANLVQIYYRDGKYQPVKDLYRKFGLSAFRLSPDALAEIAVSLWHVGEKEEARRVLNTAESYFPRNPALAAAAGQLR